MPIDFKKKMQKLKGKGARELPKDLVDIKKEAELMKELNLKPIKDVDYALIKEGETGKEFAAPTISMNAELQLYAIQGGFRDIKTESSKFSQMQNDGITNFMHRLQKFSAKAQRQQEPQQDAPVEQPQAEQ